MRYLELSQDASGSPDPASENGIKDQPPRDNSRSASSSRAIDTDRQYDKTRSEWEGSVRVQLRYKP